MSKKSLKKNRTRLKPTTGQGKSFIRHADQPSKKKQATKNDFYSENWAQLTIIFLFAIALYIQSASFDYVLDDSILIINNKFTQQGIKGIPDIFRYESFRGYFGDQDEMVEGGRYRPLSIATFALEKSLTNSNKNLSHIINIFLYALTGVFLYRVLLFMFPAPRSGLNTTKRFFTIPFVAVILFLAHPLHVEVVANVKGRDEIFALLGEIGVLYFTFRYLERKKWKYLIYSFICFFLGILSKESVITFLLIVPLTAYFFSNSRVVDKIKITLPALVGSITYLMIRYKALGYLVSGVEVTNVMNNPFYGISFSERTATIFYTLLLYLKLLIFPHPLTHDYYPYHIPIMNWTNWAPLLSLFIYATLIVIALKGWKKKSMWSYAILFYLMALSIVSNFFISVGTFMNERFMYHASLTFCVVVAWILVKKLNYNLITKRISMGIFVIGTLAFSSKTLLRLPDWKTEENLDKSAVKVSSNSASANFYYGISLWNHVYAKLAKNVSPSRRIAVLDSIKPYFEKAAQLVPTYSYANSFKVAVAVEYHKLDQNYEKLIKTFEEVNKTGTYEIFIVEYLKEVNKTVTDLRDANLLAGFYKRMVLFYERAYPSTTLPSDYKSLLGEIQTRMLHLQ